MRMLTHGGCCREQHVHTKHTRVLPPSSTRTLQHPHSLPGLGELLLWSLQSLCLWRVTLQMRIRYRQGLGKAGTRLL